MNIENLKNELIANIKSDIPVMITGAPGIGKSDLVREVAETIKPGAPVCDIRLSQFDPTDLAGLPFPDLKNGTVKRLTDSLLPQKAVDFGLLFLDEITSAPPAVAAAAYQLVLDRKCGGYTLPEGWMIIAAGNGLTDRGVVNPMPSPLANRFSHYTLEADITEWIKWAIDTHIDPRIAAFLRSRPELLYNLEKGRDIRAFASPRSWAMLSRRIKSETVTDYFQTAPAFVGDGPGREFAAALDIMSDIPSLEMITNNPGDADIPTKPAALYAVMLMLSYHTTPETFPIFWEYAKRFQEREYTVIYINDVIQKMKNTPDLELIKVTPAFIDYATTYADIVF